MMEVDTVCHPCQPTIAQRGNFFSDQYFESARRTLQELMAQMQQSRNQVNFPPGRMDQLLAELGAWQQSGQTMHAAMSSIKHDNLFATVFRFEPECLKMLVDVKGFQPFNIKLNVHDEVVELSAVKEEASAAPTPGGQNCVGYMSRNIVRKYMLPQRLVKECVQCCLSADGVLFISAPWLRC
ncbi:alpha-crystallin A chain-like [Macrosteles quadrilineatus]|uniref:alpha-crystallin A chain-like n=1 Tax=Macrosteles quadrilineatus TaxID=74068 RepID=UPI0023E2DC0F|nr:alpha-crystallin A chain-like [Macrosteles quadrilineatus]